MKKNLVDVHMTALAVDPKNEVSQQFIYVTAHPGSAAILIKSSKNKSDEGRSLTLSHEGIIQLIQSLVEVL